MSDVINNKTVGSSSVNVLRKSIAFDKTLKGEYPSYEECLKRTLKDGTQRSIAFSRNFSTDIKGNLYFRDLGVVGICNKEPLLKDKYFYLKELLEGELH